MLSNIATRRTCQLANARHLVSQWRDAHDSVGVKLHLHGLRIDVIEIELNFKYMLLARSLNLHFAKVHGVPFLFQTVSLIYHLPADCALIGRARTVR